MRLTLELVRRMEVASRSLSEDFLQNLWLYACLLSRHSFTSFEVPLRALILVMLGAWLLSPLPNYPHRRHFHQSLVTSRLKFSSQT
ncbi:hypothetical protein BDN72DRAFT_203428 [Pluteus cervinus]|uniref:Uncharacterized protein n=1 Tax=Pluteus cervinus TaxID=181527 RepID=A0ACD3AIY4_9AGAR|nr:hypothetical protein BDN72DRAFT_203428 [Pluteus cervinus]